MGDEVTQTRPDGPRIQQIAEKILDAVRAASPMFNRLIVVTGAGRTGKTQSLRVVQEAMGAPLINLNLELSQRLLDLPGRQRAQRAVRLVQGIVEERGAGTVVLDNTELLFEPSLQLDPLRLILDLSRNVTVIMSWNGSSTDSEISYGRAGHPEHRRCPIRDYLVVSTDVGTQA
jgi:hypothetical protein